MTPPAMRSTTQMGGGQFDPPPTHVDSVVSVGKRLNQITCDFFKNLGKWIWFTDIFLLVQITPRFRAFSKKPREEGLNRYTTYVIGDINKR